MIAAHGKRQNGLDGSVGALALGEGLDAHRLEAGAAVRRGEVHAQERLEEGLVVAAAVAVHDELPERVVGAEVEMDRDAAGREEAPRLGQRRLDRLLGQLVQQHGGGDEIEAFSFKPRVARVGLAEAHVRHASCRVGGGELEAGLRDIDADHLGARKGVRERHGALAEAAAHVEHPGRTRPSRRTSVDEALVQLVLPGLRMDRERARLVDQPGVRARGAGCRGVDECRAPRSSPARAAPGRARAGPLRAAASRSAARCGSRAICATRPQREDEYFDFCTWRSSQQKYGRGCCARKAARRPRASRCAGPRARRGACAPRTPRAGAGKSSAAHQVRASMMNSWKALASRLRKSVSAAIVKTWRRGGRAAPRARAAPARRARRRGAPRARRRGSSRRARRGLHDAGSLEDLLQQPHAVAQHVHLGGQREHHADQAVDRRIGEEDLLGFGADDRIRTLHGRFILVRQAQLCQQLAVL